MNLASWTASLKSSPTIALNSKVQDMKSRGEELINLVVGEPDFNTPDEIKEELYKSVKNNFTKYVAPDGVIELRKAICDKLKRHNALSYDADNIVVSAGAKQAISLALMSLLDPGDEVIFSSPYWVSYPEMVKIARGKSKVIALDESSNFKISAKVLKDNITKDTKVLLLNTPNNPSGSVYSKSELIELTDICYEHNVYIIADEIYERIVFDTNFTSVASVSKKAYEITVTINGLSKSHAMTGWRVGYLAAPKKLAQVAKSLQSHFSSHIASFIQIASIKAMNLDETVEPVCKEYKKRLNVVLTLVDRYLPKCTYIKPKGAFYLFLNVSSYFGTKIDDKTINGSMDVADLILEKAKVAITPGIAFGSDKYIRISLASSVDNLEKGIKAISKVLV